MQAVQDPCDAPYSFSDLPADYIALLYEILPLQSLIQASSTCKHWNRCAHGVWETRCLARWLHWNRPPACSTWQEWKHTYGKRHQLDCQILLLLHDSCWPERQEHCYRQIMAAGHDALDILAAAAHSNDSSTSSSSGSDVGYSTTTSSSSSSSTGNNSASSALFLGLAYHAHVALHYARGALCTGRLQQLLRTEEQQQRLMEQEHSSSAGSTAAAEGASATAASSNLGAERGDLLLQGALLLAEALHPLTDTSAVVTIVTDLGYELTRRMRAAGASPHSSKAVHLLNQLLFGPPATAVKTAAAVAEPPAGADGPPSISSSTPSTHSSSSTPGISGNISSTNQSGSNNTAGSSRSSFLRFSGWRRHDDVDGPDLTAVQVPNDGVSGLDIKGNRVNYYHQNNSCLDSVLATRQGLPISLAVLHAAVGARAGLDIVPINLPGHVINRARVALDGGAAAADSPGGIRNQTGSSSSESGSYIYIDVFEGGMILDDISLRRILARALPPLTDVGNLPEHIMAELLAPMTAAPLVGRMLRNLVLGTHLQHEQDPEAVDGAQAAVLEARLTHLQFISVALMCCELLPPGGLSGDVTSNVSLLVGICRLLELHESNRTNGSSIPGQVLLLRMIANRLESASTMPHHLRYWLNELDKNVCSMADNQRLGPTDIQRRSEHPGILHRVGELVQLLDVEGPQGQGVVIDWWPVKQALRITGYPPRAEPGATAVGGSQSCAAMSGLSVSMAQHSLDAAWYDILIGDRVISAKQSRIKPVSTAQYTDRERKLWGAKYKDWHEQQLQAFKYSWFDGGQSLIAACEHFISAPECGPAAAGPDASEEQRSTQPHRMDRVQWQLQMGQYFEAWVSDRLSPGDGGCYVPNAYVRAKYPQDWHV